MTADSPDAATSAEPVTVTDRRRIDPDTGEVRDGVGSDAAENADAAQKSDAAGKADVTDNADAEQQVTDEPAADTADQVETVRAELTADLQRLQAEYANYRRRAEREKLGSFENGKAALAGELLPVLDDLDRARAHGDLESGPLKAVADKITAVIAGQGVKPFGAEGEPFDPALHEAVQHEGDGVHPVIGSVFRQGYRLGERVLRTAMVTVTDAETGDGNSAESGGEDSAEPGRQDSAEPGRQDSAELGDGGISAETGTAGE